MNLHFGECLKRAQDAAGVTNRDLCEHFGVTRQQIYRWQQTKDARLSLVERFSEYFNMAPSDFIA